MSGQLNSLVGVDETEGELDSLDSLVSVDETEGEWTTLIAW